MAQDTYDTLHRADTRRKIDRRLKYKLSAELTGIFRWAVEGCLLWQKEGLKVPRAVLEEVRSTAVKWTLSLHLLRISVLWERV